VEEIVVVVIGVEEFVVVVAVVVNVSRILDVVVLVFLEYQLKAINYDFLIYFKLFN